MAQPDQEAQPAEHHIWCNYFALPAEGCSMCSKLWATYPYPSLEESEDLLKKHFPDVVAR